ncbi:MAG TPA: RNA polymerase sigma factor [Planctomycetota bacterium]|jgi:DNA-directed RNA polymerase specialized sigma24 family protein|nr:RNA polymerase sigma factor [Planctomycetota bacterium]
MDRRTSTAAWDGLDDLREDLSSSLAYICRDENTVDDAVQESLLKAARYRGGLKDGRKLRPWLMTIAHNCCRDNLRVRSWEDTCDKYDELLLLKEGGEPIPGEIEDQVQLPSLGAVLGRQEAMDHLHGALAEMATEDQEILRAFYWGGASRVGQTATGLSAPPPTKSRLFRARARLRKRMELRLAAEGIPNRPQDSVTNDSTCSTR